MFKFTIVRREKVYVKITGHKDTSMFRGAMACDTISSAVTGVIEWCRAMDVDTRYITWEIR